MLTSKQRAYLRGVANNYETLYQVGKNGITENTERIGQNVEQTKQESQPDCGQNKHNQPFFCGHGISLLFSAR